jgi:hypothetical protein
VRRQGRPRGRREGGGEERGADWQTKLKFNCIRTGARSEGGRKEEEEEDRAFVVLCQRDGEKKPRKRAAVWEDEMKTRTDGDGGSGEAVVVGGGGMRGEGGWRERERESESGRESKPALCSTRSFTSFLPPFQFDTGDSLARCQTTRRLKKTKVMKGALPWK